MMQQVILNGFEANTFFSQIEAIVQRVVDQNRPVINSEEEKLLTVQEAAELLNMSAATIHELKRKKVLPFYKLGTRSYLKKSEVLSALQSQ